MLLPPWQYMLYLAPDDLDLKSSLEGSSLPISWGAKKKSHYAFSALPIYAVFNS